MSDSRFNQSKWTHFAGRVPHKSLPLKEGGFSLYLGSP